MQIRAERRSRRARIVLDSNYDLHICMLSTHIYVPANNDRHCGSTDIRTVKSNGAVRPPTALITDGWNLPAASQDSMARSSFNGQRGVCENMSIVETFQDNEDRP